MFLPQLIEAVQAEYDDDLVDVTPAETARSSTTAFTPNNVLPTSSTDEADFIDYIDNIDKNDNDSNNDVESNDVKPTSQIVVAEQQLSTVDRTSLNTPLFSFLTSTTTEPSVIDVTSEPTFSNSVQSGTNAIKLFRYNSISTVK